MNEYNLTKEVERLKRQVEQYQTVVELFTTALIELFENDCRYEARMLAKTILEKARDRLQAIQ